MQTKLLILLGIGFSIVSAVILKRQLTSVDPYEPRDHRAKTSFESGSGLLKPNAPQAATTPLIPQAVGETPAEKNARIMAKAKSDYAKVLPLINALKTGGIASLADVHMDRMKGEYIGFLKTLGLSDELCETVFQTLKSEMELALARPEALKNPDHGAANSDQIRQLTSDLKSLVGDETYKQIKYWQATLQERKNLQEFKLELAAQSPGFTQQKEVAVIDALYQARQGKPMNVLNNPHASIQDKMTYVNSVKSKLGASLEPAELDILIKHLTQIAEKPQWSPSLLKQIPKVQ